VEVLLAALVVVVFVAPYILASRIRRRKLRDQISDSARELGTVVTRHFLTQPCSKCHEFEMRLLSVSTTARSISYECLSCRKKMRTVFPSAEPVARDLERRTVRRAPLESPAYGPRSPIALGEFVIAGGSRTPEPACST
jgi:hypothetical protein